MLPKQLFKSGTIVLLVVFMVVVVACTGTPGAEPGAGELATSTALPTTSPDDSVSDADPTPTEEPTPDSDEVTIQDAVVTEVEVILMESWPLQASAHVKGELGDGCTELGPIETTFEGNTFNISIKTTRPKEAVCTMILQTFEESIPLDIEGLKAGTYTVNVNGVEATFTLDQDNVAQPGDDTAEQTPAAGEGTPAPAEETPAGDGEASSGGVELAQEDRAELVRLTLERALVQQEIPDYNLLVEQGPIVISIENIDASMLPELPDIEFNLLTPEEIQLLANEQGDFLYLRFDEISATSEDKATVSLSNAWATAEGSTEGHLSGGGFTIEYTRQEGGWVGEVTSTWIS